MSKLKFFNPCTPARRHLIIEDRKELSKVKPFKKLTKGLAKTGGRNNQGRITVRHIGGGHKRNYRNVDFRRNKVGIDATVLTIEYDPNRSCYISLIRYQDGEHSYIVTPEGLKVDDVVCSGDDAPFSIGNAMPLKKIPIGTEVHNVELNVGAGATFVRSAGCYATLLGVEGGNALIRLKSGEVRYVNSCCMASIGVVSNATHKNTKHGGAGRKRRLGIRPVVRGVAMNPVDHPHGGGEGKTSGGRHPVSFSGKKTKGFRTRNNKRTDKNIVKRRFKK